MKKLKTCLPVLVILLLACPAWGQSTQEPGKPAHPRECLRYQVQCVKKSPPQKECVSHGTRCLKRGKSQRVCRRYKRVCLRYRYRNNGSRYCAKRKSRCVSWGYKRTCVKQQEYCRKYRWKKGGCAERKLVCTKYAE